MEIENNQTVVSLEEIQKTDNIEDNVVLSSKKASTEEAN